MNSIKIFTILITTLLCSTAITAKDADKYIKVTDEQIKEAIIQESIDSYPSNCPCPYSRAKNGSKCGKRSAYSKPGGYSPVCYKSDVTNEMIEAYKKASRL